MEWLTILDEFGDGIFEPGAEVTIRNIVLENNGGLTLPEGAQLHFISSDTFQFNSKCYNLPQLKPKQRITIENSFSGTVCLINPEGNQCTAKACIEFRVEFLNRVFRDSVTKREISTIHPIKVMSWIL